MNKAAILVLGFCMCVFASFPHDTLAGGIKVLVGPRCSCGSVVIAKDKAGVSVDMNDRCIDVDKEINAVATGKADLAAVPGVLREEQKDKGLTSTTIAHEPIGFMVRKENPVNNLTKEQALKIIAGRIKNWNQVGGPDKKILLVAPKCAVNMRPALKRLCKENGITLDKEYIPLATIETDIGDTAVEKVKKYPGVLCIIPRIFHINGVKFLTVEEVAPGFSTATEPAWQTSEAGKGETIYPLTREINLVTKGAPSGDVKKFVDFMTSDKGKELIRKNYTMNWLKEGF